MRIRVKPRFWLFVMALTVLVFGGVYAAAQRQYAVGARRLQQTQAYRDELYMQVTELSDQLSYAQSDEYVVRVARDELGMIMPGEVRYVNSAR